MLASAEAFLFGAPQLDGWAARMESPRVASMISWVPDSLLLSIEDHGHSGVDPHFWMDPLVVKSLVPGLTAYLCEGDTKECTEYRRNAEAFVRRLDQLHDSLATMLAPVRGSTVFLSHPFLGYFARRYGIEVAGVIEEIPGSEPTPQDMRRMVHEVERSGARVIFTQPQLPARAAEAVAEVVSLPVVPLNPLSTGKSGAFSYEELLYYNGEKILGALKGL
jgi:ABC-type Zn uptake system ZnuABC Zn-binding protein ZnuA